MDEIEHIYVEMLALKKRVYSYLRNACTIWSNGVVETVIKIKKTETYNKMGLACLYVAPYVGTYESHNGEIEYKFEGYFMIEREFNGEVALIEVSLAENGDIFIMPLSFLKECTRKKRFDAMIRDWTKYPHLKVKFIDEDFITSYCESKDIPFSKRSELYFIADDGVAIYNKTDIPNLYIGLNYIPPKYFYDEFYTKGRYALTYAACQQSEAMLKLTLMNSKDRESAIGCLVRLLDSIISTSGIEKLANGIAYIDYSGYISSVKQ